LRHVVDCPVVNWLRVQDRCSEAIGPTKPQDKYSRLVDEIDGVEERLIENGQV